VCDGKPDHKLGKQLKRRNGERVVIVIRCIRDRERHNPQANNLRTRRRRRRAGETSGLCGGGEKPPLHRLVEAQQLAGSLMLAWKLTTPLSKNLLLLVGISNLSVSPM